MGETVFFDLGERRNITFRRALVCCAATHCCTKASPAMNLIARIYYLGGASR